MIPENVAVAANGDLHIAVNGDYYVGEKRGVALGNEGSTDNGRRTGGVVQSKRTYGPGSFEVVMKIPSVNGVCSSMWLYNNYTADGVNHNDEIDIELHGTVYPSHGGAVGTFRKALCTSWLAEDNSISEYVASPSGALNDGEFHTYRIDWHTGANARIEYYIDGVKVATQTTHVPTNEMYMNIGCWFPNNWCGAPDFETDTLVVKSFGYTPFSGETATKLFCDTLGANDVILHAYPQSAGEIPESNLLANGKFDRAADKPSVWTLPAGATTGANGGVTFSGTLSQDVELDCGGLEMKLALVGNGSFSVKIRYSSVVDGVAVNGEVTLAFDGGGIKSFVPPENCTKLTIEITSTAQAKLASATLTV